MTAKSDEIYNIFNSGNNGAVDIAALKQLMLTLSPKKSEYWNKWK